jgi:hypothetical protein
MILDMGRPKKIVPAKPPSFTNAEVAAIQAAIPTAPSPAVLKLQEQIVALVAERTAARTHISEQHALYFGAQAQFQAAEAALKDVEGDVQYRLGLIAQLENRAPANVVTFPAPPMLSLAGVSSSPSQQADQNYAVGDAGDLRRSIMG